MSAPLAPKSRSSTALVIWAVTASLAAFVLGNTALLLWLKLRDANERLSTLAEAPRAVEGIAGATNSSPFARLQDSDVVGRYYLFHEGTNVGVITLLPTHSIVNSAGESLPQYHWELQPRGLMTRWQRGRIFFGAMAEPGVFVSHGKDGIEYRRLEKLPEQ